MGKTLLLWGNVHKDGSSTSEIIGIIPLPPLPLVGTPHQFLPQCGEIALVVLLHNLDGMGSLADGELGALGHALAPAVNRHQIIVAPALHVQGNLRTVVDDDRTDVQTMRGNRCQAQAPALRNDDGAAVGEIVRRRARGGRYHETVCLVSHQELAVHLRADGNHRGIVTLQHGNVVEGKGTSGKHSPRRLHLYHGMVLYQALAGVDTVQCRLYLGGQHIGKKSEPPHIDTNDGRALRPHLARRLQEGAVATHRDNIVHVEVVVLEHAGCLHLHVLAPGKEVVESTFHIHLGVAFLQIRKNPLDGSRLLGLVLIAKNRKFQMLSCHLFCSFNYYSYFCKGNGNNWIKQHKHHKIMAKVYEFLANGFEEIEGLAPVDILRRGGVEVKTVSITGSDFVETSHGITVKADLKFEDIHDFSDADMLLLPGGLPGSTNLNEHEGVRQALVAQHKAGKRIGAICAAPMVLASTGILQGKKATCSPSFERYFDSSTEYTGELFQEDGNVITGEGPAATLPYAYQILSYFIGEEAVADLQRKMQYAHLMDK